jgi:DNA-binding Lrp family transcriptional regulator
MPSHNLSTVEKKVLIAAQFAARESIPQLARRVGVRNHVAQRALKSLRDRGVISPYVVVDVSKLGFVDYAVFFSISPASAKMHRKLVQFLKQSAAVPWVAELTGEYHYAFSLICRHISDVDAFLLLLGKTVGVEMISRTVSVRTSWTIFPQRYLVPELACAGIGYEIQSNRDVIKYDELDLRLLRVLSASRGPSDAECARAIGEAATTVRYRRSLLEERGVIVAYAFSFDVVSIGRFPCIFMLQMKTPSRDLRRRLQSFMTAEPESICLLSCVGSWDYELSIAAESPSHAAEFQRRLLDRFSSDIAQVRSLTPLKTHKLEPFPSSITAGLT